MKKNLTVMKAFLIVSTWNFALKNWGPEQEGTILTGHRHSSAPRRTTFLILSHLPARMYLTLWSVHVVTLRKITIFYV